MTRALPLAVVTAMALAMLGGSGNAAAPFGEATCDNKKASLLFWPRGHGELSEPNFPEYRVPHLEVYPGLQQRGFGSNVNVYADPSGASASRNACRVGSGERVGGKVPNSAKRSRATNLQCRFGQKMRLTFTELRDGVKIVGLRRDDTKVLEMRLLAEGSSVVYNKRRCEPKPPPT
jgi:hypothetical protein